MNSLVKIEPRNFSNRFKQKMGLMDPYVIFFNFLEEKAVKWNSEILVKKI